MIDLTNKRFGRLLVKGISGVDRHRKTRWTCVCDCGSIKDVSVGHLVSGATKSCGCYRLEQVKKAKFKDISGNKSGRLKAVSVKENKNGTYYWNCVCECGNSKVIASNRFTIGHIKSCGCLKHNSEKILNNIRKLVKHQRGLNHPNWNKNLSVAERAEKRDETKDKKWRKKIFERDDYRCRKCGDCSGGNLNAHHIYSWHSHPKLRYVKNNGITLCQSCHKGFHIRYGYGKNTKKQLTKYMCILQERNLNQTAPSYTPL